MPREFSRTRRVAELVQRELARLLEEEVSDPRIRLITITAVEVSKDLRHAKVYVTGMGKHAEHVDHEQVLDVLKRWTCAGVPNCTLFTTAALNTVWHCRTS